MATASLCDSFTTPALPEGKEPVEDEYEDEDDPGYVRLEVKDAARFLSREVDNGDGDASPPLTLSAPTSPSPTSPCQANSATASPTDSQVRSGSGSSSPRSAALAVQHAEEERAAAAALLAACGADTATGATEALAFSALYAARCRAPREHDESGSAPDAAGPSQDAEEDDTELVRRYYEAREVFEFVDDDSLKASSPRLSDSERVCGLEQQAAGCSASLAVPASGKGFAGGFTFSPVSAPSPPMSLTAFSWRSASASDADSEHDLDDTDAASANEAEAAAGGAAQSISEAEAAAGGAAQSISMFACLTTQHDVLAEETAGSETVSRGAMLAHERIPDAEVATTSSPSTSRPSTPDQPRSVEPPFDTLELRIIHRHNRTGFEEEKDFPIVMGAVVAGRYQITEYLGSAAFSKAVQAHDLQTGMLVCMKIIKNSKDFFDQSLDEIKLLRLLNRADPADEHNLLRLYDYFYHREHLFIVTELLRANLYEFQKYNRESGEAPYFTCSRLQRIAVQVLHALAFMHAQQVIHCDLKPENILIRSYSRCLVKVIDVGSSCFVSDHLSSYVQSRSYRAPEVILGLPYDGRIDVWSLGCILAELYSGHVLFQNDSLATLLARCVGILGRMPARLLQARHARKYFTRAGELYERDDDGRAYLLRSKRGPLRCRLRGADAGFCAFVEALLALDPDARPTAAQALQHPWLQHAYPPDE